MPDYEHDLLFGVGVAPNAREFEEILALAELADGAGLDLIGVQDHPYQPGFLDTWTLLAYMAAQTQRIRLFTDVVNVPLRPPAVLARAAATLDILSAGRVELGLGAGYFMQPMAAMGAQRRTMGELVDALDEAITVIRSLWKPGAPVHFDGRYYSLSGAQPGPPPHHAIGIWVGAYKKRMLQLTGRAADGWIPSLGYASPDELRRMNRIIDEAAEAAGRKPADIRRGFNVSGRFSAERSGFLQGPTTAWVEQLTELALRDGVSAFILSASPSTEADVHTWAEEVVPAVREAVAKHRLQATAAAATATNGARETAARAVREAQRLVAENEERLAVGRAGQQTLLAIHQHLRQELTRLREVMVEVRDGRTTAAAARTHLNEMTMRQNYWTLGAFCTAYCRVVSVHHAIEDQQLFPDLRAADESLGPILARLRTDHEGIAKLLADIDDSLVAMVEDAGRLDGAQTAVARLSDALLEHLQLEEDSILEPIGRLAIRV
jgi:alkanesulfonate monooxygenase SsuD/methylene tetrahydromethanopterin reductase-like flavin-dependent oxidoreductase (luciferase family)